MNTIVFCREEGTGTWKKTKKQHVNYNNRLQKKQLIVAEQKWLFFKDIY